MKENKIQNLKIISLIGMPGSGKTLVGKKLQEKHSFGGFVMGEVLRKVAKEDSERGRVVNHVVENRLLIPPDISHQVISSEIESLVGKTDTIIMDGYPRNLGQLAVLDSIHSNVLYVEIAVPKEVCLERIAKAKDRGVRSDDIDPVIRERGFQTFENETAPMIQAIKKRSPNSFHSVDGQMAVDAVAGDIYKWISTKEVVNRNEA